MRNFAILTGILAAVVVPVDVLAQIDYSNVYGNPCPISGVGGVGCYNSIDPVPYVANLISGPRGVRSVIAGGLLMGMLIFYGIKLLVGSRDDNTLTEVKSAYTQALAGSIVIGGAFLLANTFAQPSGNLVDSAPFNTVALNVILFIKALLTTVVMLNVIIQGGRLIVAQEDGAIDKARKRLLHGMIGAAIVILASAVVDAFYDTPSTSPIIAEAFGIARFALTIFGALSVIGIIVAGIMLVLSVDEGLKDRARKLVITCIVALAVVITAFGIVTVFI
ncbi:hypothetical protein COV83_06965 [Candidatus Peregrinibacteria bacterium CG11_big_fil_rev_8_21_14_0_20_49_14]|nr:MAG: hypothetical protein COV83_06965 [Candidatus Peregrinibacteria bacterium CG11_big_fil_rev_8_21_14_0_20_49_14]